jgi:hypothetical protein
MIATSIVGKKTNRPVCACIVHRTLPVKVSAKMA